MVRYKEALESSLFLSSEVFFFKKYKIMHGICVLRACLIYMDNVKSECKFKLDGSRRKQDSGLPLPLDN